MDIDNFISSIDINPTENNMDPTTLLSNDKLTKHAIEINIPANIAFLHVVINC